MTTKGEKVGDREDERKAVDFALATLAAFLELSPFQAKHVANALGFVYREGERAERNIAATKRIRELHVLGKVRK